MFALSRPERVSVRATIPGEGIAVAALWRELWEAHEAWGGYGWIVAGCEVAYETSPTSPFRGAANRS